MTIPATIAPIIAPTERYSASEAINKTIIIAPVNRAVLEFSLLNNFSVQGTTHNFASTINRRKNPISSNKRSTVKLVTAMWSTDNNTLIITNSTTSSTAPAVTIKFPIFDFNIFNSSNKSTETACALTDNEIPTMTLTNAEAPKKICMAKYPIINGSEVLNTEIKKDFLMFCVNAKKLVSN